MMKVIKDKSNLFYFSLLSIRDDYIPSEKNFIRKILFSNILYSVK